MLTTSCIITVHDRVWSMDLGNPVDNAPCRLDRVVTSYGPYKVTMAAEAAHCLIESEGVTLFRHDPQQGLCDEKDFNIEVLLPSGRQYPLDRSPGTRGAPPQRLRQDLSCTVPSQHPFGARRTQCHRAYRGHVPPPRTPPPPLQESRSSQHRLFQSPQRQNGTLGSHPDGFRQPPCDGDPEGFHHQRIQRHQVLQRRHGRACETSPQFEFEAQLVFHQRYLDLFKLVVWFLVLCFIKIGVQ